jgi:hypothetical protein
MATMQVGLAGWSGFVEEDVHCLDPVVALADGHTCRLL